LVAALLAVHFYYVPSEMWAFAALIVTPWKARKAMDVSSAQVNSWMPDNIFLRDDIVEEIEHHHED
jgi:hypothetical protein